MISSSEHYRNKKSIVADLKVPNHTWQMEISPGKSWYDVTGAVWAFVISLGITALVTILVYVLEERNQNLKDRADIDPLTGLINRRKLMDYMELRCGNTRIPFTLLYCDIDDFKTINDTYGHEYGDLVLKEAARRMKAALWKEDIVARVGGDEFVMILERCCEMADCSRCIGKIQEEMAKPLQPVQTEITVSVSIGYAFFSTEAQEMQELLRLGDERMYEDKKRKKECE